MVGVRLIPERLVLVRLNIEVDRVRAFDGCRGTARLRVVAVGSTVAGEGPAGTEGPARCNFLS